MSGCFFHLAAQEGQKHVLSKMRLEPYFHRGEWTLEIKPKEPVPELGLGPLGSRRAGEAEVGCLLSWHAARLGWKLGLQFTHF